MSAFAKALSVSLGALALAAPVAHAGTYDVHACDTPAGRFVNHSFTLYKTADDFVTRDCDTSVANPTIEIQARPDFLYGVYRGAQLTFVAAPQTTIAGFSWNRRLRHFNPTRSDPGYGAVLSGYTVVGGAYLEGSGANDANVQGPPSAVGAWYDPRNPVVVGGDISLGQYGAAGNYDGTGTILRLGVGCAGNPCSLAANGYLEYAIRGATITLRDEVPPRVDRVASSGLAAGAGVLVGNEPVTFDASDNSGIKRAEVVDVTSGETVVGVEDFTCDYSFAAPCQTTITGAQVPVSVAVGGKRTLRLRVIDAGGNAADSQPFTADIGGVANGAGATPVARLTAGFARARPRVDVGYGRTARITGRLTGATEAPIAGAVLQVLDRQSRAGADYARAGEVTTDADGRFSLTPGRGAARSIRVEYRSRTLLPAADAAKTVELRVAAGATLSITPERVRPRGRITIRGRLRGLPLPSSGKVVDLQAYEGGKWRTFDTARARGARGTFTTRYRFLRAGRGASFLIRARIRRDDSYPYYLGYSPRVRVRVR
ncbi:carboxypeptidase-like regulatory domain-containing protein [Solirubrobacter soli]|uniref:carboxypeptidase-like regulatory domain-containing protein n=1 Tax=Solirubrobacter soli TaxID=363832 RepID=UPI000418EAF8|nr:carboxypeptidase-like regulatory domain-containing protein [Solirubrobacter soli]